MLFVLLIVAFLPNIGEDTWPPVISRQIHHAIHLLTCNSLGIHSGHLMCPTKFGHGLRQNVHDSRFATSSSSNEHEAVSYILCLEKLENSHEPQWLFNQIVLSKQLSNLRLFGLIFFLWWIFDAEDVFKQVFEEINIFSYKLGHVHISKRTSEDEFFISSWGL